MEFLESGIAAGLAVVLYTLVDKVVVPLIKGKSSNGHTDLAVMEQKLHDFDRRLTGSEADTQKIRGAVQEVRETLSELRGVLNAIERSVK